MIGKSNTKVSSTDRSVMPVTPLVIYSHSQTGKGAISKNTKIEFLKKVGMLAVS